MLAELNKELLENHEHYSLFGILLFTDAHAYMIKTLKDPDYWRALDKISGDNLLIFASVLFPQTMVYPTSAPGILARMRPIWVEPQNNLELLGWFDIKSRKELPLFVLFGFDSEELLFQKHRIDETSEKTVFFSLQQVLEPVSTMLNQSGGEGNRIIFRKAQWEIRKVGAKQRIKSLVAFIGSFRGVTGI